MTIQHLDFQSTGYFSKLLSDYVGKKTDPLPFSKHPHDIAAIGKATEQYAILLDRSLLSETIRKQYQGIQLTSVTSDQIDALKNEDTFCVVTAHQLCLLGGPMYFVIKIANTIRLSRELKQRFPEKNFVPVYWMGSEDHDFEEINHIRLFGKTIEWTDKQGGATGRYRTESLNPVLEELGNILGNAPFAADIMNIVDSAYQHPDLTSATRSMVHQLFGQYGLVIVNGDDKVFKKAFTPILQSELTESLSYDLVLQQSAQLEAAGYHAQASPRPINLFFLGENTRERITLEADGKYHAGDKSFSRVEILHLLKEHPEAFSPNVILRPLLQQGILPCAAFIGGGGELAYWMQLSSVFERYQIKFPVLVARTSMLYITAAQQKRIQKLGLDIQQLFGDAEHLKKNFALQHSQSSPDIQPSLEKILSAMQEVENIAASIDKTLGPAVAAESKKMQHALEQIQQRMVRSLKQQHETELKQIDQLYQQLFPNGSLQERTDNFMNIYAQSGKSFIEMFINELKPLADQMVVITQTEAI
jgi:bacillithiol synthase